MDGYDPSLNEYMRKYVSIPVRIYWDISSAAIAGTMAKFQIPALITYRGHCISSTAVLSGNDTNP